ncbi:MAG: hypothetical protein P8I38_09450 [Arenicella sp.]|nr:hypothetical protein [Arenicella sp.]
MSDTSFSRLRPIQIKLIEEHDEVHHAAQTSLYIPADGESWPPEHLCRALASLAQSKSDFSKYRK